MDSYLVYVGMAIVTVSLPGPAVMLTVNNSIQRGLRNSFSGILGIALAIFLVAIMSATALGIVLASSAVAFNAVRIVGAAYLVYIGIKTWRRRSPGTFKSNSYQRSFFKCFAEGFLVSALNPKSILFFIAVFPQFIDVTREYNSQLLSLAATFSIIVMLIHSVYAVCANYAKARLLSQTRSGVLNKVSGGVFIGFGAGLAMSGR